MNTKSNFFRQESHLFYLYNLTLILLFAVSACGEGYHQNNAADSGRTGSAALNIRWRDTTKMETNDYSIKAASLDCQEGGVDDVVFEVYDNADNNLAMGGPWPCNNGSGQIDDIPVGNNRIFVALAEDSDNNIRYHGLTSGVTIVADQYTDGIIIDAYPFIPTLSSPTDGDQLDPNGFALSWQPLDNAGQYLVQVAEYSDFENIVVDDTAGEDATYVPTTLLPSTQYYWKVYAVDRFTNIAAESEIHSFMTSDCAYTISLADNAFGAEGGVGEFNVSSSSAACTWVAVASGDWITTTRARTGTITIDEQTYTIAQQSFDCNAAISIDPTNASFGMEGDRTNFSVYAPATCSWTAASNATWI